MEKKLFRKDSLEKLTSPEELQERLVLISFKNWIAAAVIAFLTICMVVWSIVARINVFADGEAVVLGKEIYGLVPFEAGAEIRKGMAVQISLASADVKKYGYLQGTVKEVFPYLEPVQEPLSKLPLKEIQEYISLQRPYVIFTIEPIKDPNTATGYRWTTKLGPPFPITERTIGNVQVVIDKKRPISYLIPGIQ